MNFVSLFAGIGGMDLGFERAGMTCVGQVEKDEWCRKVLTKHWPDIPKKSDIRHVHGKEFGSIDLVCGGFPCQPFSVAGKRGGTEDDRYLWPEMLRFAEESESPWFVGENVVGLVSMVERFGNSQVESRSGGRVADGIDYTAVGVRQEEMLFNRICEDLNKISYEVVPVILPACAFDAKHRRDRIFLLAYSARFQQRRQEQRAERERVRAGGESVVADSASWRRHESCPPEARKDKEKRERPAGGCSELGIIADSDESDGQTGGECFGWQAGSNSDRRSARVIMANSESVRWEQMESPVIRGEEIKGSTGAPKYSSFSGRGFRWEPEPGLGRVAYGVPDRVHRLSSLGNAVVPQKTEEIGRLIMQINSGIYDVKNM